MCSIQIYYEAHEADQIDAAHYIFSHCNEDDLFS